MSMFIFHVLLLFIAITNSVFLRKDDLTFELIDQPNQINDPTTGITENEVLPDDSLPFFTDDPRGSSPIPEHSDNDPFGIADLPDPADQLLTLGDPASTPVESLFAEAGCSTHRTSSDMRRRFKWSREDGSEAPAVCKPQPIEENSPEPAKKTPIRGPDGEQCRDKKVPYCCDIDGLSRLTQTPPIYGEWGYAREYCIPYTSKEACDEMPILSDGLESKGEFHCCKKQVKVRGHRHPISVPWGLFCDVYDLKD